MKKTRAQIPTCLATLFTIFLSFFSLLNVSAQDFPEPMSPPRLVNDFADILNESQEQRLEDKLVRYDDTSSTQIAIVTLQSVGMYDISDYSFQLAEKWGIGEEGKDNGILILVAAKDRDVFIATGYGVEDVVPDAITKRIVENNIIPNFKQGDYFSGLDEATDILIALTTGRYTADDIKRDVPVVPIIIAFFILMIILSRIWRSNQRKEYDYSGKGKSVHRPSIFWFPPVGRGGGSFGGGGGGGFGGFGGGSFGGGGAGGSW